MTVKDLERLKKESLMYLELSKDKKINVTQQQLTKLMSDIKRSSQQKNLVVIVLEN